MAQCGLAPHMTISKPSHFYMGILNSLRSGGVHLRATGEYPSKFAKRVISEHLKVKKVIAPVVQHFIDFIIVTGSRITPVMMVRISQRDHFWITPKSRRPLGSFTWKSTSLFGSLTLESDCRSKHILGPLRSWGSWNCFSVTGFRMEVSSHVFLFTWSFHPKLLNLEPCLAKSNEGGSSCGAC